jgi:Major Facilitator Superfamily
MFGIFLFLTYYLQTILGYSPVVTGLAFLPTIAMVMLFSQVANVILMPRIGPKLLVGVGMLLAAAGMMWLTRIGVHSNYASAILGPLLLTGAGIGLALPPSMNTGTFGVAPKDAGVASATLNVGQQLGGSIGTALLNTIATSATASYLVGLYLSAAGLASAQGRQVLAAAAVHGYTTAFWWTAGIFVAGAVVCGSLLRWGPLARRTETQIGVPAGGLRPIHPSPPERLGGRLGVGVEDKGLTGLQRWILGLWQPNRQHGETPAHECVTIATWSGTR